MQRVDRLAQRIAGTEVEGDGGGREQALMRDQERGRPALGPRERRGIKREQRAAEARRGPDAPQIADPAGPGGDAP